VRLPSKEQLIYWSSIWYDAHFSKQSIHVIGYPKTGTNWVCNLLSAYYDIPVLESWNENTPILSKRIFHLHRFYQLDKIKNRAIYVLRDGRDAIVSRYFMVLRVKREANQRIKIRFEKFCGQEMREANVKELMPAFIKFFFLEENSGSINYAKHIVIAKKANLFSIKYEDLLQEKEATFVKCLQFLEGGANKIDRSKVKKAIELNDFKKLKNKKKQNDAVFLRKGVAGDWKNYFTQEAMETFHALAGDELILAGYEENENWTKTESRI